jgi:hypothetical protein
MRRSLLLNLRPSAVECHQKILFGGRKSVSISPLTQERDNGGLPINERSIYVEGYGIEVGQAQGHWILKVSAFFAIFSDYR